MSEGCGGVDLGGAESDVRRESSLSLCAGTGAGAGGAGIGRNGIGVEERTGVGEGGSIRFWECLVLSVARGGKSCVPFCGRVETGGLTPSLPGAGTAATAAVCTSLFVSLDCDSNIMGRLE
jgi:hypothetical protein